ncbi:SUKH-4 family immunity protein [Pedobacter sp. SL55]|uniref:SUKH-4 family immunity protein n=1 Tax=Pedobacter sp. SL55 TaxID=2995161 RepID=UPI00226DBE68|nr:SUKH-4 family immunity protein [Pedobacter sp. SL55]WAC41335.1 SUKH-4 family immunity protein [Pedobacter sp. SL55]
MTATEFKSKWIAVGNDILSPFPLEKLEGLNFQKSTIDFFNVSGLPNSSAPFLSFAKDTNDPEDGVILLTKLYDFLEDDYNRFISIGSDGSGNPIALDILDNDKVVWLDHEDYFKSYYMNSSISTLAQTLLVYRIFISKLLAENGENAVIDCDFTDEQYENLKQKIIEIDSKALIEENGFWKQEMEMLLTNREYYSTNK